MTTQNIHFIIFCSTQKDFNLMKKIKTMIKKYFDSHDKTQKLIKLFIMNLLLITSSIHFASEAQCTTLPFDRDGYTAMHNATLNNDVLTIIALVKAYPHEINRPTDLDRKTKQRFNNTPLHLAAYHGKWDAFSTLISLGANLNARNASKKTPVENILKKEHKDYETALQRGTRLREKNFKRKINSIGIQTLHTKQLQYADKTSQTETPESVSIGIQSCAKIQEQEFTSQKRSIMPPPPYVAPPAYSQKEYKKTTTTQLNPHATPYQGEKKEAMKTDLSEMWKRTEDTLDAISLSTDPKLTKLIEELEKILE